jgi:ABC-type branched-subunit amino acid transport system substrate-binding protein
MEKRRINRRDFLKWTGGTGISMLGISRLPRIAYGETKEPIKLGIIAPLTGGQAILGPPILEGATIAAEIINEKGGILGRKIEVKVEDDKFDPAAAAEAGKKLLQRDKVDFLIGTCSSPTTLAVIPIAGRANRLFIYPVEGEAKACHPHVFGLGATPAQKVEKFMPWAVEHLGKSYYLVGSDYVFPRSVNAEAIKLIKQFGGRVVGEEYAPLGTTDWSTIITRIEAAKPDVLFASTVGADAVTFIKQSHEFGLSRKMKITGNPSFDASHLPGIGPVANGSYSPQLWYDDIDNPVNREFMSKYRAKYNPKWPVMPFAPTVYAGVLFFKKAAEKVGSMDSKKLIKALEGLTVDSPSGAMTINKENHLAKQNMFICQIENLRYKLIKDLGPQEPMDKCPSKG